MLEEYVKDNHYARFHICGYQYCRETPFSSRLDIKFRQSQVSVKGILRTPCPGACLKSMPRTITMQRLTLTAMTAAEKHT